MRIDDEEFFSQGKQDRGDYLDALCISLGDKIALLQSQFRSLERQIKKGGEA